MNVIEYGKQNSDIIMLLHGGGLSWWNFRTEAELLSGRYHVVLPILDGHAESDHDFQALRKMQAGSSLLLTENMGARCCSSAGSPSALRC